MKNLLPIVEMRTLFHITTEEAWGTAQEQHVYLADSLLKEGFIHFSRPHQVLSTAELFFGHTQEKLVLLTIDEEKLSSQVKYEGEDHFPHLYGHLNLDAVISVDHFQKENGNYLLPPQLILKERNLIRSAICGDEAEISNVHVHAWQETYQGIMPAQTLSDLPLTFYRRLKWWRSLLKEKADQVFVAESQAHGIVGFCTVEAARDEEFKNYGEILALYVLAAYQKKGIGEILLRCALARLKQFGHQKAYLWVLKDNPTKSFYLKHQGIETGKQKKTKFGDVSLAEIAIEWDLSNLES